MARTPITSPPPEPAAPPPAGDDPAALKARIAELERQQKEQTASYRRDVAAAREAADAANRRADAQAEAGRRVHYEAAEHLRRERLAMAGQDHGGRFLVCLADPFVHPLVIAAPTAADAERTFMAKMGIVSTGYPFHTTVTDLPLDTPKSAFRVDRQSGRWHFAGTPAPAPAFDRDRLGGVVPAYA